MLYFEVNNLGTRSWEFDTLLDVHDGVLSQARDLNFCLSLRLHQYFMYPINIKCKVHLSPPVA